MTRRRRRWWPTGNPPGGGTRPRQPRWPRGAGRGRNTRATPGWSIPRRSGGAPTPPPPLATRAARLALDGASRGVRGVDATFRLEVLHRSLAERLAHLGERVARRSSQGGGMIAVARGETSARAPQARCPLGSPRERRDGKTQLCARARGGRRGELMKSTWCFFHHNHVGTAPGVASTPPLSPSRARVTASRTACETSGVAADEAEAASAT